MQAAPRSLRELFTGALDLWRAGESANSPQLWSMVSEAASHGRAAYDLGLHFLKSPDPAQRVIAADLLAMVALQNPPAGESVAKAMIHLLRDERDVTVLWSALVALGPTGSHTAIPVLVKWAEDEDPDLRCQAVQAAALIMASGGETNEGLAAIISRMEDADREVGYWATVSLASTLDVDTPEVRMALSKRLFDLDDTIRNEAIVGLSRRKDPRMFATLEAALLAPKPAERIFDAVEAYGDPRLVPILERADTSAIPPMRLQEVIDACSSD